MRLKPTWIIGILVAVALVFVAWQYGFMDSATDDDTVSFLEFYNSAVAGDYSNNEIIKIEGTITDVSAGANGITYHIEIDNYWDEPLPSRLSLSPTVGSEVILTVIWYEPAITIPGGTVLRTEVTHIKIMG